MTNTTPAPSAPEADGRTMTLGERINYLRTGRNWSLRELGVAIGGVSKGYLSEVERGNNEPGIEIVAKIAQAFGITPNELLGWPDSTLTPNEQALIDAYRAGDKLGAIRIVMAKPPTPAASEEA